MVVLTLYYFTRVVVKYFSSQAKARQEWNREKRRHDCYAATISVPK